MIIRNAISVEVEDYFHVSALAPHIDRKAWDSLECRVERNTQRLLDLFDEFDARGTFFVLGWIAERYPHLVKEIARRGHEVACHGFSHQLVYEQSPQEFRAETVRAKSVLEDLAQAPVRGYRAASYSIVKRSLWALDVLVEAGFSYDSSIFPIRHDRYGIPDARREPHRLRTPSGHSIVEFPMSTVKLGALHLPVSGGGYFRLFPYGVTRAALRRINGSERRPFIFYLHPWEIDPGQPRVRSGWLARFRHYNNLDKCELRLRRLLGDFRFADVETVLRDVGELPMEGGRG